MPITTAQREREVADNDRALAADHFEASHDLDAERRAFAADLDDLKTKLMHRVQRAARLCPEIERDEQQAIISDMLDDLWADTAKGWDEYAERMRRAG